MVNVQIIWSSNVSNIAHATILTLFNLQINPTIPTLSDVQINSTALTLFDVQIFPIFVKSSN